jgi:hypothetical protein
MVCGGYTPSPLVHDGQPTTTTGDTWRRNALGEYIAIVALPVLLLLYMVQVLQRKAAKNNDSTSKTEQLWR